MFCGFDGKNRGRDRILQCGKDSDANGEQGKCQHQQAKHEEGAAGLDRARRFGDVALPEDVDGEDSGAEADSDPEYRGEIHARWRSVRVQAGRWRLAIADIQGKGYAGLGRFSNRG